MSHFLTTEERRQLLQAVLMRAVEQGDSQIVGFLTQAFGTDVNSTVNSNGASSGASSDTNRKDSGGLVSSLSNIIYLVCDFLMIFIICSHVLLP